MAECTRTLHGRRLPLSRTRVRAWPRAALRPPVAGRRPVAAELLHVRGVALLSPPVVVGVRPIGDVVREGKQLADRRLRPCT